MDQDGWMDIIQFAFPGKEVFWYRNPGRTTEAWTRHIAFDTFGNESPIQADIDADGRYDLLVGDHATNRMIWLQPPYWRPTSRF